MRVKIHRLPNKFTMVGGLGLDERTGTLWLGLANNAEYIARFDLKTGELATERVSDMLAGYSYVHRSMVAAPDGSVYAGVSWLRGIKPREDRPVPFSPGGFNVVLTMMRFFGRFLSGFRVLRRSPEGVWGPFADGSLMSADLHWDACRNKLTRLSVRGVSEFSETGHESLVHRSMKGFIHELATGPRGEVVLSDPDGDVFLIDAKGQRIKLGSVEDSADDAHAAPGIDGLIAAGPHFLVGGTRNRARPFIIDLRVPSMQLLPPVPTAPRASAFALGPDGRVTFAAGVGNVGLYRLDPERAEVTTLGKLTWESTGCHHLHDLVVTADGRIFGGEFFPLDVPKPPWPDRECYLWEIAP